MENNNRGIAKLVMSNELKKLIDLKKEYDRLCTGMKKYVIVRNEEFKKITKEQKE